MLRDELIVGTAGTAMGFVGTAMQTEQVLRIVALIITIVGAILTYVVMPLLNWYKKAKQDGKIDIDELKEGVDILTSGSQSVEDHIKEVEGLDKREDIKKKEGQ